VRTQRGFHIFFFPPFPGTLSAPPEFDLTPPPDEIFLIETILSQVKILPPFFLIFSLSDDSSSTSFPPFPLRPLTDRLLEWRFFVPQGIATGVPVPFRFASRFPYYFRPNLFRILAFVFFPRRSAREIFHSFLRTPLFMV